MASKSIWRNVFTVFSLALLTISIAYLAKRSVLERLPDVDFRFIWTAGKLWAQGIDPYSPQYTTLGHVLFPTGNDIARWLYPPQWWIIARPLASLPARSALVLWRGLNAVLLLASASALAWTVRRARPDTPMWAVITLAAVIPLMEGSAQTLQLGQTSILVFAGFCLLAIALLTSGRWLMVAALVLLSLKPQFAAPIMLCLLMFRQWHIPVLLAAAAIAVGSLPQVLQFGLMPTIKGVLGNLGAHGQLSSNQPDNLIGFSHLAGQATGIRLSNALDIALDFLATFALAMLICRRPVSNDQDQAALAIALIGAGMFFLPLHDYDTVALGPVAMLAMLLTGMPRYLGLVAVALAFHPGVIAAQFGNRDAGDLFALSLAGLFALVAAITFAVMRPKISLPTLRGS